MTTPAAFAALKILCQHRHSVRCFSNKPLTDDQITAIREIAQTAPYASGKKNWELLAITDRALISDLADIVDDANRLLAERVREDFSEMFLEYARNFAAFRSAPALFVPVFKVQHSLSLMLDAENREITRWERDNYVKSIAGVTMLIQLAVESLGLGACCMTGPILAETEITRRIGAKPGFEIGAVIPVGYAKGEM